jgi:hypothetical protein
MTFARPANAVGAELVHLRENGVEHTLVTLAGPLFVPLLGVDRVGLTFALHDADGAFIRSWERELGARETIFVDSRAIADAPASGVLAVWVTTSAPLPADLGGYPRAGMMVDWFSDRGAIASLHSDQSVCDRDTPIELTEVVLRPSDGPASLVIVNGPEPQPVESVRVVLRDGEGKERAFAYAPPMEPFSVHAIALAVDDLVGELTLCGSFTARGLFTRPYVTTSGAIVSAYHAGNRYRMRSIPHLVHQTFPYALAGVPVEMLRDAGQRETNPAYAIHGPALTTRVHLFQSHGAIEDDFLVDVSLHDRAGALVTKRERFAIAPRHGATSIDVAALTGGAPFEGSIVLAFSDDAKQAFPGRLQALLEYRTATSVARTMLWSDRWNAPDRLLTQRTWRALYRVHASSERMSTLAITNPGVAADYDRAAPYVVRLRSASGAELVHEGTLAPHATRVATIAELFPERFADDLAIAIVESAFDLASMHLTRDLRSGVVAAEHLLAITERDENGRLVAPCGS